MRCSSEVRRVESLRKAVWGWRAIASNLSLCCRNSRTGKSIRTFFSFFAVWLLVSGGVLVGQDFVGKSDRVKVLALEVVVFLSHLVLFPESLDCQTLFPE